MSVVIISIGHGEDTYNKTGSKGVPGLEEHHFNAAVGIEMKELLEANGFTVYFTQQPYKNDISLRERVKFANDIYDKLSHEEKENCIYFSLHADANGDKSRRGHWCFYYGPGDVNKGKRLATLVSDEMNKVTGTEPVGEGTRGCFPNIKWPSFYEVLYPKMVAVLHEHAFMTNKEDLKLLQSDNFRKKCAEANVRAICRYLNKPFSPNEVKEVVKQPEGVYWDGHKMRPGQVGRITIIKPINLWKRVERCMIDDCEYCAEVEPKLEFERVLNPGEAYPVYGYDGFYGGQYSVGAGYYVTNMEGYVKYETPSKEKLEALQKFYTEVK
jgi:N-acetylmuramoyl-L-alanine amidase